MSQDIRVVLAVIVILAGLYFSSLLGSLTYERVRWRFKSSSAPRIVFLDLVGILMIVGEASITFWVGGNLVLALSIGILTVFCFGPSNLWTGLVVLKPAAVYLKNRGWGYPLSGLVAGMGLCLALDTVWQYFRGDVYVFPLVPLIVSALVGVFVGWWLSLDDRIFA